MKYSMNIGDVICCSLTLALCLLFGCDSKRESTSESGAKAVHGVEVAQVYIRHCSWDPLGNAAEPIEMAFVNALLAGDLAGVDALLSKGKIGINEVLCLTGCENLRRGRLLMEQTRLQPPVIASGIGAMYSRFLNAYCITDKCDPVLGKNDVIEFYGTPLMMAARAGNTTMMAFLLEKGANPNVFIKTQGILPQYESQAFFSERNMLSNQRPWSYLCALTDCYVRTVGKTIESEDDCAALLFQYGAAMPPDNAQGQSGLWEAAKVHSRFLLEQFVKAGADVNHKDHLGMTVADYVYREASSLPPSEIRQEYEAFFQALLSLGGQMAQEREGMQDFRQQPPEQPGHYPATIPPPQYTRQDRTAEIAALELQLKELRLQLVDARHDAKMNAISGVGALSAQMRVMSLINAIYERERRLRELQEQ